MLFPFPADQVQTPLDGPHGAAEPRGDLRVVVAFHPGDGQLYACGMFAWAGSQQQPGGFYRVRYTGRATNLPLQLHARQGTLQVGFSDPMDAESVANANNFRVKVWSLKRTANYGSPHINEHSLKVVSASLGEDGRSVTLQIPDIGPTWCMEVRYTLRSAEGRPVNGTIHNTIHHLGDPIATGQAAKR